MERSDCTYASYGAILKLKRLNKDVLLLLSLFSLLAGLGLRVRLGLGSGSG